MKRVFYPKKDSRGWGIYFKVEVTLRYFATASTRKASRDFCRLMNETFNTWANKEY